MKMIIDDFCGVCSNAFSKLLDAYQMKDWGMSWQEFLEQFVKEVSWSVENWKKERIGEDEE